MSVGSLAEADTRETLEQVAAAKAKIKPLTGRFLRAKKAVDALEPPEDGSPLGRLGAMTTPFSTSELVVSNLHVGVDNLRMFFRYLDKTNELPTLAHYGLIRSPVEATSYGLWVLAGKQQEAASRTLWLAREDQANASRLFGALGVMVWDTEEMQRPVRERHEPLKLIERADLDKEVQATNTITAVEHHFEHRAAFTRLHVWRATSGLTRGSPPAVVGLLERAPDGTRTSPMVWSVAFLETAIENFEALLARVEALSQTPPKTRPRATPESSTGGSQL